MRFVAFALAVAALAACNQPMARDPIMTDCHDGTFCGPVFPVCTGRALHPCEAASDVPQAWGAKAAADCFARHERAGDSTDEAGRACGLEHHTLCAPIVDGGCDDVTK